MQEFATSPSPNPHDIGLHKQIKDVADLLRPELLRLHKTPTEISGNVDLYRGFIENVRAIRREVTNCDALFAFHNILNHMSKILELVQERAENKEILWHLQDVMSLLFKVQNLPS
jgi:hypothetical protein